METYTSPAMIKLTHWVSALALLIMATSGWRIYDASPIFNFTFPKAITLGGWLGGAIQWHFAAMWLFTFNGLVYLAYNLFTGRLVSKFLPIRPLELTQDFFNALSLKLAHPDLSRYNAMQKVAYLSVLVTGVVIVASGLAVWKPVQFPVLVTLMGDFDKARVVHFIAMAYLMLFLAVHLLMVALVPRALLNMLPFTKVRIPGGHHV